MADLIFGVNFEPGRDRIRRMLLVADALVAACEVYNRGLISISSPVTLASLTDPPLAPTTLALEGIEVGSYKIRIRYLLEALDDEALRKLDARRIVGSFLVGAKYAILEWMDEGPKQPGGLESLRQKIRNIAIRVGIYEIVTEVRRFGVSLLPERGHIIRPAYLVSAIRNFQRAKDELDSKGGAYIEDTNGRRQEMNLGVKWTEGDINNLLVSRVEVTPAKTMALDVRKEDYFMGRRWEFNYGRGSMSAWIEDTQWLLNFYGGNVNIRSGDTLVCETRIETAYDIDGRIVEENFFVEKVVTIQRGKPDLFSG